MHEDVNSNTSQGSFLNGFTVGIFAGAVGYFLFGTDKGGKVRQTIGKEWDQAKVHLAQEGVIPSSTASIRDIFKQVIGMFVAQDDLQTSSSNKSGKTTKDSDKAKKQSSRVGGSQVSSATSEVKKKRTFRNV